MTGDTSVSTGSSERDDAAQSPSRPLHGERSNAALSWLAVVLALALGVRGMLEGRVHEVFFAASVAVVALAPAIALDRRRAALPWEITVLAVAPLLGAAFAPDPLVRQLVLYAGAAPLALGVALELHALTEIRIERWLAAAFVTGLSAALAATWAAATWLRDLVAGTDAIASNDEVMWLFVAATAAGLVAGTAFDRYYRRFPGQELVSSPVDGVGEAAFAERTGADDHPTLEERLPLGADRQRRAIRLVQASLAALIGYGVLTVETQAITNGIGMLVVSLLPAILRRRYDLPIDRGLELWVTVVVLLHAIGSAFLYEESFWWHNLTHPLSATVVGAVGYVVFRTLDDRRDDVHFPPALVPAFVVLFVIGVGVFWEIGEFTFDLLGPAIGVTMPLSQHGLDDTMTDLVFNAIGATAVAVWGLPYLSPLTAAISDRLEGWPVFDYPIAPWADS